MQDLQAVKVCQNCKQSFVIEPEDFRYYEEMRVPAPSWCPDCRLQRRLLFRNERVLYKRTCDLCAGQIISIYRMDAGHPVYCQKCFFGDGWDPMVHGTKYDFDMPFFTQFRELLWKVPVMALFNSNPVNSDYCNYAANSKNCYLFMAGRDNEDVSYSNRVSFSRDSMDCYVGHKLERSYGCIQCESSYGLLWSRYAENCTDSAFLYDCKNCQNCFLCAHLRNAQYRILNQAYSKEDYFKKLQEFRLDSYAGYCAAREKYHMLEEQTFHKYAHLVNSSESTGDNLYNCKNCKSCFDISSVESENCKYTHYVVVGVKDSYDNYGMPRAERVYETIAIGFESNENSHYYFSYFIKGSSDIWYSFNCISSQHLFGCVGLRNKSYCIFNTQYTKEEYEALVPKIREQMMFLPYTDQVGRVYAFGEFFPPELSYFAYNETVATEYFPLSREEVLARGFDWREPEFKQHATTRDALQLPDLIRDVPDSITHEVIGCAHQGKCSDGCTFAYRITARELEFYRHAQIPFPRMCPNCRHADRLKERNPMHLYHRSCDCNRDYGYEMPAINTAGHAHGMTHCVQPFETSYTPDSSKIIYCEPCYRAEVS